MTLTDSDVLDAGPARSRSPIQGLSTPRSVRWGVAVALAAGVAGVLLAEVSPWNTGPAPTGLRVLITGPSGLTWVDVDSGARAPATDGASDRQRRDWSEEETSVVGSGVVVQYPSKDAAFADSVVGYVADEQPYAIGEADLVAPASGTSVWLVVDGDPPTAGGVALASAYGTWRSRVFSVPPNLQVVGAAADGLVAVRGGFRARRLILWDPQLQEQIRDLGWVVAVREVADRYALVTTGCVTFGCSTAMVDLVTGRSTALALPTGWREVGEPHLAPAEGGVAVVVADETGRTALAVGPPDDLQVVDALTPAAASQAVPGPDGWLLVSLGDGDVVAWRNDLGDAVAPRVELSDGEWLVGVSQ
ncbi:MAG: hypothetical protein LH645_00610 [Actinomycetia bacterium]|nr:hypothetical protein [Actinomycetes bacterium]